MIYNVKGTLTYIDAQFVVVECGGVGFKCFTTLNTSKSVGKIGSEVNLYNASFRKRGCNGFVWLFNCYRA